MLKCCFVLMEHRIQMDCIYEKKDVTMRYESVMGKAEAVFPEGEEKQRTMDEVIMPPFPAVLIKRARERGKQGHKLRLISLRIPRIRSTSSNITSISTTRMTATMMTAYLLGFLTNSYKLVVSRTVFRFWAFS